MKSLACLIGARLPELLVPAGARSPMTGGINQKLFIGPAMLALILLICGCQHAAAPLPATQQGFFESIQPSNPEVEQALRNAKNHNLVGRFDLALQELNKVIAAEPQSIRILIAMGNCYDKLGQHARAREVYERILTDHPDHVPAQNNLGYSCYLAGDFHRAEQIFQEILAAYPEDTVAQNNLGMVWCRQGKESQALELWKKTAGETPARQKLLLVLASLDLSAGQPGTRLPNNPGKQKSASPSEPLAFEHHEPGPTSSSGLVAMDRPETSPPLSSPGPRPGKSDPRPQVQVEEVQMIVQPANYTQPLPMENDSGRQPRLPSTPPAEQIDAHGRLLPDEAEASNRQYSGKPGFRGGGRYPQAKPVHYDPLPRQEGQSLRKSLVNESVYKSSNNPNKSEFVY